MPLWITIIILIALFISKQIFIITPREPSRSSSGTFGFGQVAVLELESVRRGDGGMSVRAASWALGLSFFFFLGNVGVLSLGGRELGEQEVNHRYGGTRGFYSRSPMQLFILLLLLSKTVDDRIKNSPLIKYENRIYI